MNMVCPKCGFDNLQDSTFCTECGQEFSKRQTKDKKRGPYPNPSPLLALLLSTLIPGAGQCYNKEYKKAGIFFVFVCVYLLAMYFFGTFSHIIFISLLSILEMYMLQDAYFSACRIKGIVLDSKYRKKVYSLIGIGLSAIFLSFFSLFNRSFSTHICRYDIPAFEIMKNDRILIKKNYYVNRLPAVGDLVSVDLILGEIIEVDPDKVWLQGAGGRVPENLQHLLLNKEGQLLIKDISMPMEGFRKRAGKLIYIYAPIERRRKL